MCLLASILDRAPVAYLAGHAGALSDGLADSILPDPLAAKDLVRADPREIAAVVRRRIEDDRLPIRRAILRYPKNFDPDAYRTVTSLDILDQYAYRHIVSPCARLSAQHLPASVLSMRAKFDRNNVWHLGDPRAAWKLRQRRILDKLETEPSSHLLVMDVAQFYPSLAVPSLAGSLNSLGVSDGGVLDITGYLDSLNGLQGTVDGLPIGPDGSAVLGTSALISVDRALASETYVRFVDDIWVITGDSRAAEEVAERVSAQLDRLGLKENTGKRRILTGQEVLDHITDAEIDYFARPGNRASVEEAMDLIASGIDEQKLSRIRFGLGTLKRHQSTILVPRLLAEPTLIDADPKAFGSYLGSVMPAISDAGREALVALVTDDVGDHQIGRRIHVAAALGRGQLNEPLSGDLHRAAIGMANRKHQLIRTHALVAACRGAGVERRLNEGVECAEATDNLDLRRAVGDAHRRASGRRRRVGLDQLCRIDPEVRPFVQHLR
jgi:hypothetical protein